MWSTLSFPYMLFPSFPLLRFQPPPSWRSLPKWCRISSCIHRSSETSAFRPPIWLDCCGRLELGVGDNIIRTYRTIFNPCHVIGQQSHRIRRKKRKITAIMPFKVIEVGINRKLVCDILLVINNNWHFISYRFGVIAAYYSNFGHCVFEPPMGRGLETTYDVYLGLIGKRVVDFLLVWIELFTLGVMAEALPAKI